VVARRPASRRLPVQQPPKPRTPRRSRPRPATGCGPFVDRLVRLARGTASARSDDLNGIALIVTDRVTVQHCLSSHTERQRGEMGRDEDLVREIAVVGCSFAVVAIVAIIAIHSNDNVPEQPATTALTLEALDASSGPPSDVAPPVGSRPAPARVPRGDSASTSADLFARSPTARTDMASGTGMPPSAGSSPSGTAAPEPMPRLTPSPTSTATPSASPTPTPSPTVSPTLPPEETTTPTPTPTGSSTPSPVPPPT
jgi:hypothetical protein